MKGLSKRQNYRIPNLSLDHGNGAGTHRLRDDNLKSEGCPEDNEEESGHVSYHKGYKRYKIELEGEFKKFNPPTFDGEAEEVFQAWLINMNKYF